MGRFTDRFTDEHELAILSFFFTNPYGDISAIRDTMPGEIFATFIAAYSRTHEPFQKRFVQAFVEEEFPPEVVDDIINNSSVPLMEKLTRKSGAFIEKWALSHGHNSIREMGHLRFHLEGVSDLVGKLITGHPQAHPQVKSSRYLRWDNLVGSAGANPSIRASPHRDLILETLDRVTRGYSELTERLRDYMRSADVNQRFLDWNLSEAEVGKAVDKVITGGKDGGLSREGLIALEKEKRRASFNSDTAKTVLDTSRYALVPSMPTSLGALVDTRCASDILNALYTSSLPEANVVGELLHGELVKISPFFMGPKCHVGPNNFEIERARKLTAISNTLENEMVRTFDGERVHLYTQREFDVSTESGLAALLLYPYGHGSLEQISYALQFKADIVGSVIEAGLADRGEHDPLPAELGMHGLLSERLIDYGAERDLFRHRKGGRLRQKLTTIHGFETPDLIKLSGCEDLYKGIMKASARAYELIAKDVNWIRGQTPQGSDPVKVMAKIRYNSKTFPATISMLDNNQVKVTFEQPQSAITPGQACVFYDELDQILLGGGWIKKPLP